MATAVPVPPEVWRQAEVCRDGPEGESKSKRYNRAMAVPPQTGNKQQGRHNLWGGVGGGTPRHLLPAADM